MKISEVIFLKNSNGHLCGHESGASLIEFALVLPIMLLLMLGIFDYGRVIQANNIIINLSREGGNLVARTPATPQYAMSALASTSSPLEMNSNGGMIITQLTATADDSGRATVVSQSRWVDGRVVNSHIWNGCGNWSSGECILPSTAPVVTLPVLLLKQGDAVYTVEVFYRYNTVFGFAMPTESNLYSLTLL